MAACYGTNEKGHRCAAPLFQCKHCGHHGCIREDCTNCNFRGSRCLACGKIRRELAH